MNRNSLPHLIVMILLWITLIGFLIYVYINIELLNENPCSICEKKVRGMKCNYMGGTLLDYYKEIKYDEDKNNRGG